MTGGREGGGGGGGGEEEEVHVYKSQQGIVASDTTRGLL